MKKFIDYQNIHGHAIPVWGLNVKNVVSFCMTDGDSRRQVHVGERVTREEHISCPEHHPLCPRYDGYCQKVQGHSAKYRGSFIIFYTKHSLLYVIKSLLYFKI